MQPVLIARNMQLFSKNGIFSSVTAALFRRDGGLESPCKWPFQPVICALTPSYYPGNRVSECIVSVGQHFIRPIVRGKARKSVEFGAKLDISVVNGRMWLECCSFDAYNEAVNLQAIAERFREREEHYPARILADKNYRNRENRAYCKQRGFRLSGPALSRPKKDSDADKRLAYLDECERMEVERCFNLAKRKCGIGLVTAKLRETAAHVIVMSILVLDRLKVQCAFCGFGV